MGVVWPTQISQLYVKIKEHEGVICVCIMYMIIWTGNIGRRIYVRKEGGENKYGGKKMFVSLAHALIFYPFFLFSPPQ